MESIIKESSASGIQLFLDEGKLRFQQKKGSVFTAELKQKIVDNKADIIEFLDQYTSQSTSVEKPVLAAVNRNERQELSFAQQRLWFIDQLNGASLEYSMFCAFTVTGEFNVIAAEKALKSIIRRHEILRTVYMVDDQGAIQHIQELFDFQLEQHDLSMLPANSRQNRLRDFVESDVQKPFDLTKDLMVRASFILLDKANEQDNLPKKGALLFNMHHIASDGWSMDVLVNEFITHYQANAQGVSATILPLEIQYADYAHWQRQWLQGEVLQSQLDYWGKQLIDVPAVHGLRLDKPRPDVKQHMGAQVSSTLSADIARQLQSIASLYDITPFMLLHAFTALVLSRHSNSTDIVIGTPVANRSDESLESLIGFFVNTLVLRVDTGYQQLGDYLKHVRQVHLDAQSNQDVPFEQLIDQLKIPRIRSHTPLFQVILTTNTDYGLESANSLSLPGIELSPLPHDSITSKFDLDININISDQGVSLDWVYDTSIFEHDRINQLNKHLSRMLTGLAKSQNRLQQDTRMAIKQLPMLSCDESDYLIHELNQTREDLPYEQCLHDLFIKQVVLQPGACALHDHQGSLSYEEVFHRSYSLCTMLQKRSIDIEELVMLRIPKGRWQLIASLAIMMAGGAYLPVEIKWPVARCEKIANKAHCRFVLVTSDYDSVAGLTTINISELDLTEIYPVAVPSVFKTIQQPDNLAYVIFTSGSTGEPKGVAIEHRSAVNTILDINAQYDVNQNDKVLAVSALSFDLSVYDFFGLLAAGGVIIFPEDDKSVEPSHWLEQLEKHEITLWNTVPASAELLIEQLFSEKRISKAPLRNILMSGDWISPGLPKRLWNAFPGVNTYSLGGATEGSIWSIHYPIEHDLSVLKSIPYGKPLSNQNFYILDWDKCILPVGCVGNLYIGGVGIARCYYGDQALTENSFIYHSELGQRLYRTGDLGRYMPDGNIEFLGREDHQVKIRGFRIEMGEIEQQLLTCDGVASCLGAVVDTPTGGSVLVAYIMQGEHMFVSEQQMSEALKTSLRKILPEYMIPSFFVFIDKWPLTGNGKVDKKSLPVPVGVKQYGKYIEPTTDTEKLLVQLWSELLEIDSETVSAAANFFELGGHSVMLVKMLTALKSQLNITLSMRDVFQHSVLRELAKKIELENKQRQDQINIFEKVTHSDISQTEELVL